MGALTADRNLRFKGPVYSEKYVMALDIYPVTIYKGMAVCIDTSEDTDHVTGAPGVTLTTGDCFVGIAAESKSVVVGETDEKKLEVYVWPTIIGFKTTAIDETDIGKLVYLDGDTLGLSGSGKPIIGRAYKYEDGYMYVIINPPTVI